MHHPLRTMKIMQEKHSSRILLALDISPRSRAALEMAAALAAELDVELAGLFVEDIDLLRLSGLPFARELGIFSPDPQPMAMHDMERALRREAEEVQRLLAEAAARLRLRWSFQVARGRIVTELFAQADEFDLIVLGKCARSGLRLVGDSLAEMESKPKAAHPVVAVFDNSAAACRALGLSARLARASGANLQVLATAATAEACARHIDEAKALLAQAGFAAPACRCLISGKIAELSRAVRQAGAGLLVLDGDGRFRSGEGFAALLNEIDCPVILVG